MSRAVLSPIPASNRLVRGIAQSTSTTQEAGSQVCTPADRTCLARRPTEGCATCRAKARLARVAGVGVVRGSLVEARSHDTVIPERVDEDELEGFVALPTAARPQGSVPDVSGMQAGHFYWLRMRSRGSTHRHRSLTGSPTRPGYCEPVPAPVSNLLCSRTRQRVRRGGETTFFIACLRQRHDNLLFLLPPFYCQSYDLCDIALEVVHRWPTASPLALHLGGLGRRAHEVIDNGAERDLVLRVAAAGVVIGLSPVARALRAHEDGRGAVVLAHDRHDPRRVPVCLDVVAGHEAAPDVLGHVGVLVARRKVVLRQLPRAVRALVPPALARARLPTVTQLLAD
jgi:hypothetical protein